MKKFNDLEYLYCSESFIFDTGLCHVIRNCQNLQHMDIRNCRNVTLTSVETIFEVISRRKNDITLVLMLDYELAILTQNTTPRLLKLYCEKRETGSEFGFSEFYCPTKINETFNSRFLRLLAKLKLDENNVTLPWLNEDDWINILRFVPIKPRIRLERGEI